MKQLPILTPKKLFELLEIPEQNKYVAIYYQGTNAIWTTGYSLRTFSYFGLYELMINHLAIAFYLDDEVDLGSDDTEPTHVLLFEKDGFISIAEYLASERFLKDNNPAPPPLDKADKAVDIAQWYEKIENNPGNFGMFEMFAKPNPEFQQLAIEVIQDLDQQVTEEMFLKAIEIANKGSGRMLFIVNKILTRIQRTIEQNN